MLGFVLFRPLFVVHHLDGIPLYPAQLLTESQWGTLPGASVPICTCVCQ